MRSQMLRGHQDGGRVGARVPEGKRGAEALLVGHRHEVTQLHRSAYPRTATPGRSLQAVTTAFTPCAFLVTAIWVDTPVRAVLVDAAPLDRSKQATTVEGPSGRTGVGEAT